MSVHTSKLLGRKPSRKARKWQPIFAEAADRLVSHYGVPLLGNYADPVREIVYIVLSAKTTETLYQKADGELWTRFATLAEVAAAPQKEIADCIKAAGLANKRAAHIKRIASRLAEDFGDQPAVALRSMSPEAAFDYLTQLPGVGPKSAFCIMMCSLEMDVFPVDVNVHRVAHRLGALRAGLKHYHAQQMLPSLVPAGRSKELHVGMVVLGREVCLPRSAKCEKCVLLDLCRHGKKRTSKSQ